jgi:amino-acid N-acetyltransferase
MAQQSKQPYADMNCVNWFRNAAPYINAFRQKTFVIYFSGDVLADNEFPSLIHDITLLHSLGIKLVLAHGARSQIETRLQQIQNPSSYSQGLRVTDAADMQVIKEVSGSIRFDIEALFSTSLKYTPMAGSAINIISGNFVIAKPLGIINGIDYQHTGEVRNIDAKSIKHSLNEGGVVLLSPIGYSTTGETFNLNGEDLATQAAIALKADKLIFIDDSSGIYNLDNQLMNEITIRELEILIQNIDPDRETCRHYKRFIKAGKHGIKRIHIINRNTDGALLIELFTNTGIGTMVSSDFLDEIRTATANDVNGIIELIKPLEKNGQLVKRSREILETEIDNFYIIERENAIIGCAALYPVENTETGIRQAELACFAIDREYRSQGRGDKLFDYVCKQAKRQELEQIFILTTQASHWFAEQGFKKSSLDNLPTEKRLLYNYQRNSAIYIKNL